MLILLLGPRGEVTPGSVVLVVDSWLAWSGVGPVLSSDTDPLFSTRPPHCLTVS